MGVEARVVLEERSAPSEPPAGAWTNSAIPAQLLVPWTARAAGPVEHLTVAGSVNLARIGHIDLRIHRRYGGSTTTWMLLYPARATRTPTVPPAGLPPFFVPSVLRPVPMMHIAC